MSCTTASRHDVTHRLGGILQVIGWLGMASLVVFLYFFVTSRNGRDVAVTGSALGRTIVNFGLEARIIADHRGKIVACSPTAAEVAGYSAHELIGQPSSLLMPDDYKTRHVSAFRKAMEDEDHPHRVNIVRCNLLKKDGTIRPVEVIVRVVDDGPDEWGGKVAVVTITPVELIKFTPVDKPAAEARKENISLPVGDKKRPSFANFDQQHEELCGQARSDP